MNYFLYITVVPLQSKIIEPVMELKLKNILSSDSVSNIFSA